MIIEENTVVELTYELYENNENGQLLEIMDLKWPLKLFVGGSGILKSFENHLVGLRIGDNFAFTLTAEEAYGHSREDLKIEIPKKDLLQIAGGVESLNPGDYLEINANPPLSGVIERIQAHKIILDCNHFLAGKNLFFKGTILNIRKASLDELIQKRYIEPDGVRF